jgi:hypothetical protein
MKPLTPAHIDRLILIIRGQKVMLDVDLARLYGVSTKALKQAVRRNRERFPEDFMIEMTWEEARSSLRSQTVTLKRGAHMKFQPFAFTEQGVAMLSTVLRSPKAIRVNIEIMRAFVRLRRLLATHTALARRIRDVERKYDGQFEEVFRALAELTREDSPGRVGFR